MIVVKEFSQKTLNPAWGVETVEDVPNWESIPMGFARRQYVLELKEKHLGLKGIKYIIENGLATAGELMKYKGKSLERIGYERAVGAISIINNVVG